ncbi:arginine kinase isoform X2 [Nematostella vectensis]|uniref:arginine kinase isoform X2 n=1 Tax=Nematostella vectensis TaxID=45351 RepID=UPI0020776625|nr:arginine kinase isoform X2 [Nematostella vectensis]
MSSERRHLIFLAAVAATGAGFAATIRNDWIRSLLGLEAEEDPSPSNEAFREILLQQKNRKTVASQFLNEAIYEEYKDAKTVYGFRLFDILSYDVSYRDTIGIRATDEECYYTFIKLFDPVISNFCVESYRKVPRATQTSGIRDKRKIDNCDSDVSPFSQPFVGRKDDRMGLEYLREVPGASQISIKEKTSLLTDAHIKDLGSETSFDKERYQGDERTQETDTFSYEENRISSAPHSSTEQGDFPSKHESSYPRVEKNVSYVYPSNVVSLVGVTGTLDAHVVSCRVRVVRSLQGFPFAWVCSPNERREIQNVVKQALDSLKEPDSEYYKLARISSKSRDTLITKHGIFRNQKLDCDDTWSSGRGIWRDGTSNAIALVNEREHIIFLTQEFGGDLCHAFYRMRDLVERTELALEKTGHKYMHSVVYGFLVSSPQEVGTGLRISVNVKLPHLLYEPRLPFIMSTLGLEKRQRARSPESYVQQHNSSGCHGEASQ